MPTLTGTPGDDTLTGTDEDDTIRGGAGNDVINGLLGTDQLYGEEGDDTFVFSVARPTTQPFPLGRVDGGEGIDTLDLRLMSGQLISGDRLQIGNQFYQLVSIERILLGNGANTVNYSGAATGVTILGGSGVDVLTGGSGADILRGGAGADILTGGAGDSLYGDDGNDVLSGADHLDGGAGNDDLRGTARVTMIGGAGDDIFRIGSSVFLNGHGLIDGGEGHNALFISTQQQFRGTIETFVIDLEAGLFTLTNTYADSFGTSRYTVTTELRNIVDVQVEQGNLLGNGEANILRGGRYIDGRGGNDWIDGTIGNDTLIGGSGDDEIETRSGQDIVDGGEGVDTVNYRSLGVGVTVSLAAGTSWVAINGILDVKDRLTSIENVIGSGAADYLTGDTGANRLDGGAGNDSLWGGDGDDFLIGGAGDDMIDGGAGVDTAVFTTAFNPSGITGSGGSFVITGAQGRDTVTGVEYLQFSDRTLAVGADGRLQFAGTGGIDFLSGTTAADRIIAGDEDDSLNGGAGDDWLEGGAGDDLLIGGAGDDTIEGGDGIDTAIFAYASTSATFTYEDGTVIVDGPQGRDVLRGVEALLFSDGVLDVGSDGRVILPGRGAVNGTAGADVLTGTALSDVLNGGAGNDILIGRDGSDVLNGGDGIDIAVYSGVRRQYQASMTSVSGGIESGIDSLTSVERIQFLDGTLMFDIAVNSQAAQVMRLYDAALDRSGDPEGVESLLARLEGGETLLSLAEAFLNSAEFQARYGGLSNREFVEQMYRLSLDREGEESGILAWVNTLDRGRSRANVLLDFSESREHQTLTLPLLSQGLWVADREALIISRLYDAAFDRVPDVGGLRTWVDRLDGGTALVDIAAAFAASGEFQDRYGGLSNQQFVEQMYRLSLDREGDVGGIQSWTAALDGGMSRGALLLAFSESAEHVRLTAPLWLGGVRYEGYEAAQTAADAAKGADDPLILIGMDDGFVDPGGGSEADDGNAAPAADQATAWPLHDVQPVAESAGAPTHAGFDHHPLLDLSPPTADDWLH